MKIAEKHNKIGEFIYDTKSILTIIKPETIHLKQIHLKHRWNCNMYYFLI